MIKYNLTPECLKDHLNELVFNPSKINYLAEIETNVKTKLTKSYNARISLNKVSKGQTKTKTAEV